MSSIESDLASLQRVLERVQSAKSEDISTVLSALLPKLVPLVNQDALRTKAMTVVSESLKRLRLEKCKLNITKLLPCIHPTMLPYAANIAVTVVDKVIEHGVIILQSDHLDIAKSLILSIGSFQAYSPQSNALCYYALVHFHEVLMQQFPIIKSSNTIDSSILTKAQHILGDFLVDISLLQRPLVIETDENASSAGSVQSGLSPIRVDRISSRKKTWTLDQLKALKLTIINVVPSGLLLPVYAVLVSVVLVNDADASVATQATYKMNGCANMLDIDQDTVAIASVCEGILSICSKETAVLGSVGYSRSMLRADIRLSALRWLVKYLPERITPQARQIVRYVFQLVFSGNATVSVASLLNEEVAVVGASFQLLETVLRHLDSTTLMEVVLLVMVCIKKVLQSFAYSTSTSNAGEHHMQLRSSCYRVVECIASRYTATGREERAKAIDSLALRNEAAAEDTTTVDAVSIICTAAPPVASNALLQQLQKVTAGDAELLMLLFQLLDREHAYHIETSILAIYRAMNSLREGYVFMNENDSSSSNANISNNMLALKELLRKVRRSDRDVKMRLAALQWARALFHWDSFVLETLFLLADDESSAVVVFAVTEFRRLERFLKTALSEVSSAEYEMAVLVLSDVIALLLSSSSTTSQGAVPASMRGLYLLLSVAATGLRLVNAQSGPLSQALLASWDLPGMMRLCAGIPIELPVLQIPGLSLEQGRGVYFTSLRVLTDSSDSTADASVAGPEGAEENHTDSRTHTGSKSSTAAGPCAPILRCIASITACVLQLSLKGDIGSDALALSCLQTGRSVLGNYLAWLSQPEVDIREDLRLIFSQLCCVSDLSTCGDAAHSLEEELNQLSTLQRQLAHKLAPLRDIAHADPVHIHTAAGALTCLGAVSARLQEQSATARLSSLEVESARIRSVVTAQLTICLQMDSTQSIEHTLLQVVALEVLGQLNMIKYTPSTECSADAYKEMEVLQSLLLPLLQSTEPRIVVPALGTYAQLVVVSADTVSSFWEHMMMPALLSTTDQSIKFAWAKAMMYVCLQPLSIVELREVAVSTKFVQNILAFVDSASYIVDDKIPIMVSYLLHLIGEASLSSTASLAERSTYCVALLVLIKACEPGRAFAKAYVRSIVDVLLRYLKDKDVFLQDICCMALCHLYSTADRAIPAVEAHAVLAGLAGQPISVADYIAQEVMLVLMRERRAPQPVGYSAGATTSSRTAAAQRNATTAPGTGSASADTGAVAGGGGGAPAAEVNHLMQAAVAAAAELGVGLRLESAGAEEIGNAQPGESRDQQAPQDYVVFSSICKMAKTAKDNSVLFAVLALIRRDPIFGTGSSRVYSQEYASPQVSFPTVKLVQMLPMLFHARFDPNNTVRPVMRALWDALMLRHFPQQQHVQLDLIQRTVVGYLCQKLHSPQWRDREAACLALEAFLPRRSWQVSVFPLLEQLFHSALRVLDDMRDSTRSAAISFTKALSSHIVRACTPEESSADVVATALDKIMPLLLEKGLVAPSAEARGVSLGLLGKVVEAGKTAPALRQWLAQVISVLIEGMSAMEPQTLQYMQFHTARLRISEEELEAMRIKMAQSSPLHDALESCLGALQQAVLHDATTSLVPEVVGSLCSQLQRGVGLPTRVAAAQALSQMVERYPAYLAPGSSGAKPTAEAFRAIIWTLSQAPMMAVSLKKAMTSAFGVLAKVVDEEVLTEECTVLVDRYIFLERDQLDQSLVLAQCIQQIVQRGGQRLDEGIGSRMVMWNRILSCAFLGSHERDPECKAVWEATWEASLSASGAGTKLSALLRTFSTVVGMVHAMCKELSWHRRVQAVEVLREVVAVVPDATLVDQLRKIPQQMHALLRTLLSLIPGPIWGGQAAVLEAVSEIVCKCEPFLTFTTSRLNETLVLEGSSEELETELRVANLTNEGLMAAIISDMVPSLQGTETVTEKRELWSMHFLGWVLVLVHESRRGSRSSANLLEAEYRMAAARALSLLPWQRLCATMAGQNTFHRLLPVLLKQSGIPPFGVPVSVSDSNLSASADSPVDAGKSNSRRNKRTLGSAALFGVRYQQSSKETAVAGRVRTAATVTTPDPGTVSNLSLEAASTRGDQVEENMAEKGMDVQDEVEAQPSGAAMAVEEEEETAVEVPQSGGYVEVTHKHQPVYYLSYLDCLVRAWPKRGSNSLPADQQGPSCGDVLGNRSDLMRYAGFVLDWAESAMLTQVWSIRRTAVKLLGTISSSGYFPEDIGSLARLLGVLEAGIQEGKYAKVRVEALCSLAMILQASSPLRAGIDRDEGLRSRVREIMRTASADSQPTILEAVAKVQNVWFA